MVAVLRGNRKANCVCPRRFTSDENAIDSNKKTERLCCAFRLWLFRKS